MARSNGCNGQCCVNFPIGDSSHAEVLKIFEIQKENKEVQKISSMLILISDNSEGARYACIHFDTVSRLCMDYENRPAYMCGNYPYEQVCKHCWLTLQQLSGRILTSAS